VAHDAEYSFMTLDSDNNPWIVYTTGANGDLMVAYNVPEPSTALLLSMGIILLVLRGLRRRRR